MEARNNNADCPALEQALREKQELFRQAEEDGKTKEELRLLYQELKDLQYQLSMCRPTYYRNQSLL